MDLPQTEAGVPAPGIDPTPSWSTDTGRVQAKIELAEALVLNGQGLGSAQAEIQLFSDAAPAFSRDPRTITLEIYGFHASVIKVN